ncbi:MAG: PAS domain S-box protein [Chrysiogenia bacterium]
MNKAFFLQLVFNASLLLTLVIIYDLVAVRWRIGRASLRQVPVGVVIGIMGVIVMLASWKMQPGIVFDTRSILLGISGLFFGTVPTAVAMVITAAFRASMGGPAAGMGIAVIFASGAIGIAWRRMRRPFLADITWRELYLFGMIVHLAMLGCTFFLPGANRSNVLANIVLPVLLVYPVVTAILGRMLADQLKREITNQKLRESEERYQTLANVSPVGIFRTDKNGATTFVNPTWCKISGLSEEQAMGDGWLAAVHPDDREAMRKGWQETIRQLKPSFADYRFLRQDGTVAWVMGQATPEINLENQIIGYVGTITDISERKRAEEEIKMLATALKRINECVSITDVEDTILFVNEAFQKTYGYSEQELIGQNIKIVRSPNFPQQVFEEVLPGTLSGGWTGELVNRRKDGSEFPVFLSTSIIGKEDGKPNYLIGITMDITERKRAVETIRASLQEKEILLKEVHHRVKNNLMSVIGLIKMTEAKAKNEKFNALLQEFEGRVRSMALVHESLHKSADLAHIDLQYYLETLTAHIRAQYGAKRDIRFSVQAAKVTVDPDFAVPCGLILNELITNAYKHAFPKNRPRSGEGNCEIAVTVKHEGNNLTLSVADNGIGLPAVLDWDKSETLGLKLIKMLSKQLNGTIEVDRSAGTVFRLKFPAALT